MRFQPSGATKRSASLSSPSPKSLKPRHAKWESMTTLVNQQKGPDRYCIHLCRSVHLLYIFQAPSHSRTLFSASERIPCRDWWSQAALEEDEAEFEGSTLKAQCRGQRRMHTIGCLAHPIKTKEDLVKVQERSRT